MCSRAYARFHQGPEANSSWGVRNPKKLTGTKTQEHNEKNAYCIHCGQLILGKISRIGAIRCHILRLKSPKFDFHWGCAPDPAGELTALPQSPYSCT